jgi:hypothetical protein
MKQNPAICEVLERLLGTRVCQTVVSSVSGWYRGISTLDTTIFQITMS